MKKNLFDWFGTFLDLLATPTPKTFREEAAKADGKFSSAVGWLVFYALYICVMASIAVGQVLPVLTMMTIVISIPMGVILFVSAMNFICQRVLHRKQYIYEKLLYLTVAILLPVFVVVAPISITVPASILRIIIFVGVLYQVGMLTIMLKSIANIAYWQAFVTVFVSLLAGIVLGFVIYILVVATISPPGYNVPTPTPTLVP